MVGSILQKLQSVGIGVLAAVATVVAIDHFRERPAAVHPEKEHAAAAPLAPGQPQSFRTVIVNGEASDKISTLEQRLQNLEKASPAPAEPAIDAEQQRREITENYAKLERAHEADAQDREWAPSAQRQFLSRLTPMSEEFGFKLGPTECKTTTCRAAVTFSNYAAARRAGTNLIERVYPGLNCNRRIWLDEPKDVDAPYTTKLYLECADQRAGLVDEIAVN